MANEATIRSSLSIRLGSLNYQSLPNYFRTDVSAAIGPTPGAISVTTSGVSVDLSELTTPGLCRLQNLDDTNYVEYGIWDGSNFYPLGDILPGETYIIRLAQDLFFGETGTAVVNSLRLRADTATCLVLVEAFEK